MPFEDLIDCYFYDKKKIIKKIPKSKTKKLVVQKRKKKGLTMKYVTKMIG